MSFTGSLWDKKLPITLTPKVSSVGKVLKIMAYKVTDDDVLPEGVDVTAEEATGEAAETEIVVTANLSALTEPGEYHIVVIADKDGVDQALLGKVEGEVVGFDGHTNRA